MKEKLKLAAKAFAAAVTSPEAVKLEKGLVLFIAVRVALAVGASASFIQFIESL